MEEDFVALGLFQRRDHLLGLKQQLDLEEVCVFAFPCWCTCLWKGCY